MTTSARIDWFSSTATSGPVLLVSTEPMHGSHVPAYTAISPTVQMPTHATPTHTDNHAAHSRHMSMGMHSSCGAGHEPRGEGRERPQSKRAADGRARLHVVCRRLEVGHPLCHKVTGADALAHDRAQLAPNALRNNVVHVGSVDEVARTERLRVESSGHRRTIGRVGLRFCATPPVCTIRPPQPNTLEACKIGGWCCYMQGASGKVWCRMSNPPVRSFRPPHRPHCRRSSRRAMAACRVSVADGVPA
jgi:hypothetical protein